MSHFLKRTCNNPSGCSWLQPLSRTAKDSLDTLSIREDALSVGLSVCLDRRRERQLGENIHIEGYCRKSPIGLTAYLLLDALDVLAVNTRCSNTGCAGPLPSILRNGAILVQTPPLDLLDFPLQKFNTIVWAFSSHSTCMRKP